MRINYLPDPGVEPTSSFEAEGNRIPAIQLSREWSGTYMQVQLSPDDPADAVRYLRQLAAVATDLADQVENAAKEAQAALTEAVLSS